MNHARTPSRWLWLALGLVGGCMAHVEAPGDDAQGTLDSRQQALDFQAAPFDPEPPLTEIPSCWWVDDPTDCDVQPECVPKAPSEPAPTAPQSLTVRRIAPTRTSTSTTTTMTTLSVSPSLRTSGTTSTALKIKPRDPCPSPNGVGTCSTCSRSYLNPWQASLELSLASRVLITNGLNSSSYIVKNYPVLNAQALGEEGTVPTIDVNLSQGTTLMQSGSVNFTQDLYMFFTSDFETGPYPVGNWVFCPKNGNTCVQISD